MRTQEQIIADCERRCAELREEADRREKDPLIQHPCRTCRFARDTSGSLKNWTCTEPLVTGFDVPVLVGTWRATEFDYGRERDYEDAAKGKGEITYWKFPRPCGPEKALWQPKLTCWQRFFEWLGSDK